MPDVKLGDRTVTIEPFSVRKGIRVIRSVEQVAKGVPELLGEWGEFTRNYEATHVTEIERATARWRFGPRPLLEQVPLLSDEDVPVRDARGDIVFINTPKIENGEPVMGPDPLAHMTEEDWVASGHKLRMPSSPDLSEKVMAILPKALEVAEKETLGLLALLAMSNGEVKHAERSGFVDTHQERIEAMLDLPFDDLIELAVVAGEVVDTQFQARVKKLGERLPNALRLFGIRMQPKTSETSSPSSSKTSAESSTDSPTPTDGTSEPSSTELVGSSSSV
jgi:hypothetical protein